MTSEENDCKDLSPYQAALLRQHDMEKASRREAIALLAWMLLLGGVGGCLVALWLTGNL